MHVILFLVLLFADPFWDKPVTEWTESQLEILLTSSPWAQVVEGSGRSIAAPELIYIASAEPVRAAEAELRRRDKKPRHEDVLAQEYRAWMAEDGGKHIVLAARVSDPRAFSDAQETKQMEKECFLKIGRKKVRMDIHFPPSSSDPFVRLAFPKEGAEKEKNLQFELYLPGVANPYRAVEFTVKDMVYQGKPSF